MPLPVQAGAIGAPDAPAEPLTVAQLAAASSATSSGAARHIFRVWLLLFALVGVQMSWLLRPFIGRPEATFTWFRPREASFFHSVWEQLGRLLGG